MLRQRTRVTAAQFIAGGVDPNRSAVFCQSHVTEHAELGWVMNCLTGFGEASRMTQFKDKTAKGQNANVGLFAYPMLMAADILMYDAAYVPVGEDQRQHLEITRDLAERFNTRFGATLVVPDAYIVKGSAKIMDLQDPTSKMSKTGSSPKGLIDLMEDPARIAKNIRSAVTDTDGEVRYDPDTKPGVSNLLVIHSVLSGTPVEEVAASFAGRGYGDLKKEVADVVVDRLTPFQKQIAELLGDPAELDRILADGASQAREVATRRWLECVRPWDCSPVPADQARLTRARCRRAHEERSVGSPSCPPSVCPSPSPRRTRRCSRPSVPPSAIRSRTPSPPT